METRHHKQLSIKEYRCLKYISGPAALCGPVHVNLQQANEQMLECSSCILLVDASLSC